MIINLIIVGLAANKSCVDCESAIRTQFVDAVIFGYFIVNCLLVVNIFIDQGQEFHQYWKITVALLGAVLFLVAGILVLDFIGESGQWGDYDSRVTITTMIGIFSLIMTLLYVIETVLLFKNK